MNQQQQNYHLESSFYLSSHKGSISEPLLKYKEEFRVHVQAVL